MTTARSGSRAARGGRPSPGPPAPSRLFAHERLWVACLLALHLGLAAWGAARNSVTFDENFHLPAGVMIVARGDYSVSEAGPPLVKSLCALPVLAMGAHVPAVVGSNWGREAIVGEAFMRQNVAHYHTLFFAGRTVIMVLSLLLGLLVWRWARRLYGARGGLLALALYALAPEALAHAGVVGLDMATGLTMSAAIYAFWVFCRTGRWRWWLLTALATGAMFLTRLSAVQLGPVLLLLAALGTALRRLRRRGRVWLGLFLLIPTAWLALVAGYRGDLYLGALRDLPVHSRTFHALAKALPEARLPLPLHYLRGLDAISVLSEPGGAPTYLLGRVLLGQVWYYFPLALLFKWPLGFLGVLVLRAVTWVRPRPGPKRAWHEAFVLIPAAMMLGTAMFATKLNVGVRYLFPLLPLLCIWCGGLMRSPVNARAPVRAEAPGSRPRARAGRGVGALATAAFLLAALQAVETGLAAPWYLSFFNWFAGGPGGGYRLVNDSNVDWGQGLIALRDEMRERGIERIHLAYHGTTDPAVYGINYVPYMGGAPGPESEWLAVSSYYYVGLMQRMMTQRGRTLYPLRIDFQALWGRPYVARPAGCMFLFRIER